MTSVREQHAVWSVYDRLRSARLSVKYFCWKLERAERTSFWLDLLLLATAPASAVAGLWFWQTEIGRNVWQWLGLIAAVAAVVKPLLHLTKKIKDYESLVSGYRVLDFDLMELKGQIEQRNKYDAPLVAEFKRIQQRERALVSKNPESRENRKMKQLCVAEVDAELPAEAFFVPEE
jgi:hypothetical protein